MDRKSIEDALYTRTPVRVNLEGWYTRSRYAPCMDLYVGRVIEMDTSFRTDWDAHRDGKPLLTSTAETKEAGSPKRGLHLVEVFYGLLEGKPVLLRVVVPSRTILALTEEDRYQADKEYQNMLWWVRLCHEEDLEKRIYKEFSDWNATAFSKRNLRGVVPEGPRVSIPLAYYNELVRDREARCLKRRAYFEEVVESFENAQDYLEDYLLDEPFKF